MNAVAVVASVLVGLVFVVAGASKLAAGPRWSTNARDLGAPGLVIPVIPWIELAIGAGLVAQLAVPVPAIAALVMLAGFSMLLVVRIRAGERPACACFGAWSASPIGWRHLARNAVLAMLAVLALWA